VELRLNRWVANYGDWQFGIYLDGLTGKRPALPMSYEELERQAERKMSAEMWSYVAGGAGNERTQRANVRAFEGWGLMPRMLASAAERDLSVELFGRRYPTPLLLAPVGVIGTCAEDLHGDLTAARAAAATGVPMVASTLSQDPMEAVAAEFGDTPGWFQLYPPADRELCESLVRRAEAAGFSAIVITLDTLTLGWRPRDLTLASFPQLKGLCLANYTSDPVFRSRLAAPPEEDMQAATGQWAMVFGDPRLSWDDLPWLRSLTSLPLLLKGICAPEDARRAADGGVDGLWCSNHGGRQANGGLPALDCLPGVVDAAGAVPVIFDSGVRSGADVAIALALGARAVAIGRPYAYGLAVGGQAGIEHVLRSMLAELDLIMAVDGYPSVAAFDRDALRRVFSPR
jgi:lactate 2-monooxygenase